MSAFEMPRDNIIHVEDPDTAEETHLVDSAVLYSMFAVKKGFLFSALVKPFVNAMCP
jgi:hypothetical protein